MISIKRKKFLSGIKVFIVVLVSVGLFCFAFPVIAQESLAPLNPDFLEHFQRLQSPGAQRMTGDGYPLGFIPSPLNLSHLAEQSFFQENRLLAAPSFYDLRTLGKLTPVRNQGSCGSCWSFATYGSLESNLLPSEIWDFSENHLKNNHGFDLGHCEGGNEQMSTAYLARWSGPANEADDPYNPSSNISPSGLTVRKHLQEVLIIPNRLGSLDNENIKQAIMAYGALMTSMYFGNGYYNSTYRAYYYNGTPFSNHAVAIVGWDDNFDKNNFSSIPPGDGAFIIKNSWGTSWGENGYFYISYYDTSIGKYNYVFNGAEPTMHYSHIYQYDPLGWLSALGYGSNTAWFSNIFTASASESLAAVSFHTASPNSSYELYIYTTVTSGPTTGSLAGSQTGTIASAGYHTISLNSPVPLISGQKFSIVMKLTTPGYNYPIPIEEPFTGYSSQATANPGESYVSSDGSSWTDLTSNSWCVECNVCLKAFTSMSDITPPTPNPMSWATLPYQNGTTSISMVATTATDPTAPIQYYFNFTGSPTEGVGGMDSGWQSSPSYVSSGLQANHQYGYRVKARDGIPNETSYSTPTLYAYTAIEAPTGINFGTLTPTSIQVQSINTPSGLARGSSGLLIENMTKATNSGWKRDNNFWTSGSLSSNKSYSFRAKTRNGNSVETGYSSTISKYTLAKPPVAASFSNVTQNCIRASWTADSNPGGTQYYCENTTDGTNSGWTTNLYWDSCELVCGVSYSFRVKAINGDGIETGWTSLGSRSTVVCPPPPAPTNVQASDGTYTDKVQVTWTASPDATSYTVYRATSTSSRATKVVLGTTSATTYDDITASVMVNYYYYIKATNSHGTSGYSAYNRGYRSDGRPPAPTNVIASDGTNTDKVQVTWTASPWTTSYTVYRATSTSSRATKVAIGTTTTTTYYEDTTASVMVNYYYYVKASNSIGTSGYSAYDKGYRSDGRPPPPTNVSASDGTYTDKVQVTWTASPNADSYTVYRATSTSSWVTKTALGTIPNTPFEDTTASAGKTYYYWVKASNSYGTSGFSAYNTGYR